ncbi:MAG: triose-phosphate isomerase, partial [Bacillota bacterium]|nr:triose-phosphate isomerase [Bacillota bacterium]
MRIPIIAGNWKMHKSRDEAIEFVVDLKKLIASKELEVEVVICPPFTSLEGVLAVTDGSDMKVGAQNMHWENKGAFTGEISPKMLADMGCHYVIIGHSERRQYFAETDNTVNLKVKAALQTKLIPIVCVGESLEEREQGVTQQIIGRQLELGLAELTDSQAQN